MNVTHLNRLICSSRNIWEIAWFVLYWWVSSMRRVSSYEKHVALKYNKWLTLYCQAATSDFSRNCDINWSLCNIGLSWRVTYKMLLNLWHGYKVMFDKSNQEAFLSCLKTSWQQTSGLSSDCCQNQPNQHYNRLHSISYHDVFQYLGTTETPHLNYYAGRYVWNYPRP